MNVRLRIDNREVEVPEGATLLEAARALGIAIPTLCHAEGLPPSTSCMVCVVKVKGRDALVPSCAVRAEDGMEVESETEEVAAARKAAVELLLSDHVGDCVAPCHALCPARMEIPRMLRQIAAGAYADAIATVKRDIALPATLGRICPAPCEKGCRRAARDAAVSICLLKRFVADVDLESSAPYRPACAPPSGKKVAIAGAGPAGLAAAYHLLQAGHACTLFDALGEPGGMLRRKIEPGRLPPAVLDAEIARVTELGAQFVPGTRAGADVPLAELRGRFDAVLIAAGELPAEAFEALGLPFGPRGILADKKTFATPESGVFAAGGVLRPLRMAVRAVADGKEAARSIDRFLTGRYSMAHDERFSTHIGKLREGEIDAFMTGASPAPRVVPAGDGMTPEEAAADAARCLRCDCRKQHDCALRHLADACGARAHRYKIERRAFAQLRRPGVIYEPGKCILCGICIAIAEEAREPLGLTFVGRGFNVRVGVPLNAGLAEALTKVADRCVRACPTAALAYDAD
ncbi:MAG TPA: glutamate synthase [Planctomycetes bacterium]|nr:glutamate synthase [Planctomycetota bacterium]